MNWNHKWTADRDAQLRVLWAGGASSREIARQMFTTVGAILDRRSAIELPTRAARGAWTDEQDAVLKEKWAEGWTCSRIAEVLRGKSRNAVIGRLHRLGLNDSSRSKPGPARTYRPKFKAPAVPRALRPNPPKPGPQNKPGAVFGAYQHEPDFAKAEIGRAKRAASGQDKLTRVAAGAGVESPNAVPFLDYVSGCKWPIGERGAVSYCCNPVAGGTGWGKRFCQGHYQLAISPNQPNGLRQRDASRLTRFDRVERDRPAPARQERTLWDDAREAA